MAAVQRLATRFGKRLAAAAGLRVRRAGPGNRFEAMGDALGLLRSSGYLPRVVIDGGANVGQWSAIASTIFDEATFHLIEPQPACHARLRQTFTSPRFQLHPVALTRPGVSTVRLASLGGGGVGTGAFVTTSNHESNVDIVERPAVTLDSLFAGSLGAPDRALLKLDLEGHEIEALDGAAAMIGSVEVLVIEVTFFDIYSKNHRLFDDVLRSVGALGFALYDFAALYPRARDQRLRMGDAIFVARGSPLLDDVSWD
jgi:FkbM family methyltransferase